MSDRRPKDKLKYEFNPLTGELDLIKEFNPNRIITHRLSPFANARVDWDPIVGVYYVADDAIVTDGNGNVVTT